MIAVKIRAELADGKVHVGPIMGNGGMIGSSTLHVGRELAERQALYVLRLCQDRVADGRGLPVFEPKPGHVAIYPHFSASTDGERIYIPLAGTTFTIEAAAA